MQERKQEVCDKILPAHTHTHMRALAQTRLKEQAGGVPFKMLTQMYKHVRLTHTHTHTNNTEGHEISTAQK